MNYSRRTEILATCCYAGRAPFTPGTLGTIAAIPLVFLLRFAGHTGYIFATFFFTLFAIWVADKYESMVQDHDTREVVIDEVVGFIMAVFWVPLTWQSFVLAFVIFRFLDIVKPFPISFVDQRVNGGFGTVLDDLVAGVLTNLLMQFIYTQTTWLGVQWVPST